MPYTDLTVEELAKYLHITPQQVHRLVSRDDIPHRRIGGEIVFPKAGIRKWLEKQIGLSDHEELLTVENRLRNEDLSRNQDLVTVHELLVPEAISLPLPAKTRSSVIRKMADICADAGLLWDPKAMAEAVLEREEMYSTALGSGVALLHPRHPMAKIIAQPFLGIGITTTSIPFGKDAPMADIFFLICSSDDRFHLRALARLSRLIGQPDFLDTMRKINSPYEMVEFFTNAEAELTQ